MRCEVACTLLSAGILHTPVKRTATPRPSKAQDTAPHGTVRNAFSTLRSPHRRQLYVVRPLSSQRAFAPSFGDMTHACMTAYFDVQVPWPT